MHGLVILESEFHLQVQDLLILLLCLGGELLEIVEETRCGRNDLALVNTPLVAEFLQNLMLLIKYRDCALVGNIVQTDDTVRDTLRLDETNPPDFCSVVTVSTAAGLCIDTVDVYNSERVAWDDTTLVEVESEFLLSFSLVHEILVNGVAVINNSVSLIFNSSLFLLGDTLEVSDVQVSTLNGLLGTILPHMRSEDLAA